MSLSCKIEAETEVLQAPSEKVYEFFKLRPYDLTKFPSTNIQSAHLLEGDWGTKGCLVRWNYSYEGKAISDKEMVEAIDDKNRSITWKMVEGHLITKIYKSFKAVIQVTPKGDDRCVVRFIMEYEKPNEETMDPHGKLQFSLNLCKEIAAYLMEEQSQVAP